MTRYEWSIFALTLLWAFVLGFLAGVLAGLA